MALDLETKRTHLEFQRRWILMDFHLKLKVEELMERQKEWKMHSLKVRNSQDRLHSIPLVVRHLGRVTADRA